MRLCLAQCPGSSWGHQHTIRKAWKHMKYLHLQFLLWYTLGCSPRVMSVQVFCEKKKKNCLKNMLSFFMVFFSSIRRWSEQSTTLLLPDFVATDYFYLNIFFTTWEILDIHIYFMWKPIKKKSNFLWTYFSSQTTLLKWIAVLCSVICYFIYLPSNVISEENVKVLTESANHVNREKEM